MIDAVSWLSSRISATGAQGVDALRHAQQPSVAQTSGPSFGQVFEQVSREAIDSLRGAEASSLGALQGNASTLEVVEAIKAAEHAVQTATAVRDKVVQAYQEVSRMAI
jgi:flagellar hook-basal body complex protein FliE